MTPDARADNEQRAAPAAASIAYDSFRAGEGQFRAEIHKLLEGGAKRFCDVGGGAKPVVSAASVQRYALEYVVLDESQEQLSKVPSGYRVFQADILDAAAISELMREQGPFDVVVSRWAAEHIADGRLFHEQVFQMLRAGGSAVHYFPTLYALPFLANRLLSPGSSAALLFRLLPNRYKKFRAYYSWCRGPSTRQLRRLRGVGYRIDRYVGYFGHGFYARVKLLHRAHEALTRRLLAHPWPSRTSFALLVLRRPA